LERSQTRQHPVPPSWGHCVERARGQEYPGEKLEGQEVYEMQENRGWEEVIPRWWEWGLKDMGSRKKGIHCTDSSLPLLTLSLLYHPPLLMKTTTETFVQKPRELRQPLFTSELKMEQYEYSKMVYILIRE